MANGLFAHFQNASALPGDNDNRALGNWQGP
jgi:hypothetical protein